MEHFNRFVETSRFWFLVYDEVDVHVGVDEVPVGRPSHLSNIITISVRTQSLKITNPIFLTVPLIPMRQCSLVR